MPKFLELLRYLDNCINQGINNLVSDFKISTLGIFIIMSMVYGIVHSLGPGHGKSLVASFFMKEKYPLKKSLTMAAIVSIIHIGSAIILSFLLYFILTGIKGMLRIKMQGYFMAASGILITIMGLIFLGLKILKASEIKSETRFKNKNFLLVGISAGIVPCPVTLTVMLFSLSKGVPILGIVSAVSISVGMFMLISLIGFTAIKFRDGILFLSDKTVRKTELVSVILEYASIAMIIVIGLLMSLSILLKH